MAINLASTVIPPFSAEAARAATDRQGRLTKPTGSLGRLEELSIKLAGMTGVVSPDLSPALIAVFAADHGVTEQQISPYPREVTAQMVYNYARGGAVINALARNAAAELVVVDVGVAADLPGDLPIVHRKVRQGTGDWTVESAMTLDEAEQALMVGADLVRQRPELGLLAVGEMGIGNTTTASVLSAAFTHFSVDLLVGRGAGIDDLGLQRKRDAVAAGLARLKGDPSPMTILAEVGGLEIAAMTGAIIAAAERRIPIVLDGFISTCAAVAAVAMCRPVRDYLIASHRSEETGHRILLETLKLQPLLQLGMRLGEGSGAALAIPLIRASRDVLRDVATFEQAGVSDRDR